MFYFLTGLVPWYPVCHILPTFVHRGFPSAFTAPPLPRIPFASYFVLPALCDLLSVPTDTNGEQFVEKVYAPLLRNKFFKAFVVAFAVAVTAILTW